MFEKLAKPRSMFDGLFHKPIVESSSPQEPSPVMPQQETAPVVPPEATKSGKTVRDKMFNEAARLVVNLGYGSTHLLQTKMKIGHAHARKIVAQLEKEGIVAPQVENKARGVLMTPDKLESFLVNLNQ
jgi:S-DNA-T family DNA segregation ATPase FtsK/SpoIIIE